MLRVFLDLDLGVIVEVALDVQKCDPIQGCLEEAFVEPGVVGDCEKPSASRNGFRISQGRITLLEVGECERGGGVDFLPESVANGFGAAFDWASVAPVDDSPELSQFWKREVFAEEIEVERSRVGGI